MKLKLRNSVVALAALALVSGAVASAQIVQDGSFGSIASGSSNTPWSSQGAGPTVNWTGAQYAYDPTSTTSTPYAWTFSGDAGVQQNGSAWGFPDAPGAGQTAFLQVYSGSIGVPNNTGGSSSISQALSGLTIGDTYTLSFYLDQRPAYGVNPITPSVALSVGGDPFMTITPPSNSVWTLYTETFTASETDPTLSFTSTAPAGSDDDTGLADVSIVAAPEGGAGLMFLLLAGAACGGGMYFKPRLLAI